MHVALSPVYLKVLMFRVVNERFRWLRSAINSSVILEILVFPVLKLLEELAHLFKAIVSKEESQSLCLRTHLECALLDEVDVLR